MSDVQKVKKPKSNFLLFCDDKRAELKVARPELKSTEIVRECSRLWQELPADKKDVYTKKYQALKDSLPKIEKAEKPKSNRPKSAYINFCTLDRTRIKATCPDLGPKELMKKIAEEWNKLSVDEKAAFKADVPVKKEDEPVVEPVVSVPDAEKKPAARKRKETKL